MSDGIEKGENEGKSDWRGWRREQVEVEGGGKLLWRGHCEGAQRAKPNRAGVVPFQEVGR